MRKFLFLFFVSFFALGCQSNVPNRPAKFSDFIPKEEHKKYADFFLSTNFVADNFPDECEWISLSRVVDGDTVVVKDTVKVRLVGIDTPETKHPNKPIEPFGVEASAKLKELLKNSAKICLIVDEVGDEYDRYGRRLGYIFTEEGMDINAELLHSGLAKAYVRFPFERKEEFVLLQSQAQKNKVGQWE